MDLYIQVVVKFLLQDQGNDIVLPQLAMAYEVNEDTVLRFSYGKSMGRPSLQDLKFISVW